MTSISVMFRVLIDTLKSVDDSEKKTILHEIFYVLEKRGHIEIDQVNYLERRFKEMTQDIEKRMKDNDLSYEQAQSMVSSKYPEFLRGDDMFNFITSAN